MRLIYYNPSSTVLHYCSEFIKSSSLHIILILIFAALDVQQTYSM